MPDENSKVAPAGSQSAHGVAQKEQRREHRFRVGWHVDIVFPDRSAHRGFIKDISILGAAVFLEESPNSDDAELHIHIPPLDRVSQPHIVVISSRMVYVVFDGDKRQFRAAYVFSRYHQESDRAYLEERLAKYQMEIH